MPRIYTTKGAEALSNRITVTMKPETAARLERRARAMGVVKTLVARTMIEQGLLCDE